MPNILYVRRPGASFLDVEPVPLAPNTTELRLPFTLELSGGHTPNHVHHLRSKSSGDVEQIAIWLDREQCRYCKAGYR